jgi:IclR family transcriptional regulator, acetate operon repressor
LHCTASGKLFLAFSSPSLRKALFRTQPLPRHTPRTLSTAVEIEPALDEIRKSGVGTDNEEFMEGMSAAAVPVYDSRGRIFATVAVHGPVSRLPLSRAVSFVPALKRAARAIENTLIEQKPSIDQNGQRPGHAIQASA